MQLIKISANQKSILGFWFICDLTLRFRQTIERFAIAIRDEPGVDSKWTGSKAFTVVRPEVTDYRELNRKYQKYTGSEILQRLNNPPSNFQKFNVRNRVG